MLSALIVDDEQLDREGLFHQIDWQRLGIGEVLLAQSGREALELMHKRRVDLLITDISMPRMNGIELVREAVALNFDLKVILISAYDEFEYARSAIRLGVSEYILKPVEKKALEDAVQRIVVELGQVSESSQLHKAIQDQIGQQEFDHRSSIISSFVMKVADDENRIKRVVPDRPMFLAILEINDYESQIADQEWDGDCHADSLERMVMDSADRSGSIAARINPSRYIVFFSGAMDEADILKCLESILRETEEQMRDVDILLSEKIQGVREIPEAYQECCRLLMKKALVSQKTVLRQGACQLEASISTGDLYGRVQREMAESIRDYSATRLTDFVHSLFVEMETSRYRDVDLARNVASYIISTMQQALDANQIGFPEEEIAILYGRLVRCETFATIRSVTERVVEEASGKLARAGEQHKKKIAQMLVDYIAGHYSESFTLKEISAQFYYSPNHLGLLFREAMGQSFYTYLTRYRMNVAAHMLGDPTKYIYEVARHVSFKNTNSFSIQFKKVYGVTPKEYVQRLRGDDHD